jgi:hypothetical protein
MTCSRLLGRFGLIFAAWLLLAVHAVPTSAQDETPTTERLVESIERLQKRIGLESLEMSQRSEALDEAIDLRSRLIREAPSDPRRSSWHADQAEDLILKRIEFPNSWKNHLLNADLACPMMPPEIPLIVARGLSEATRASRLAADDIRILEGDDRALENVETMNLLLQLRFDRDVRGPLLESIGLVLASRIDAGAAPRAFEQLKRLAVDQAENEAIARVVDRWIRLAAIESGDAAYLASEAGGIDALENELDRIRATMQLKSPRAAASLASRTHQMKPNSERYLRLLIADLRERALELDSNSSGGTPAWNEERGDLWITMLTDSVGRMDWSFDGALSPRIAELTRTLGTDSMPLAGAWSLGEEELSRRALGEDHSDLPRKLLEQRLAVLPRTEATHARALSVLARLAISDSDRLGAALALERLYLEHPDVPGADSGRVAELLEPLLGARDEPWIATSYERALRSSVQDESSTPEQRRLRNQRLLALADHLSNSGRRGSALETIESIQTKISSVAAELIIMRAKIVHEMLENAELEGAEARKKHLLIAAEYRKAVGQHGASNLDLQLAGNLMTLEAVHSRLLTDRVSPDDARNIMEIARDDLLPDSVRIDALITRHQLRMKSMSDRQNAITQAPDLIDALRINDEVARELLLESALVILDRIDKSRAEGNHLNASRLGANQMRPFALAFETGVPLSSRLMDRVGIARILSEGALPKNALSAWDVLAKEHPGALEIMVGRADVLWRLDNDEETLGEAMMIYRRLGRGEPGSLAPENVWWQAQLRQLLILEKVGRSLDRIGPRIERLRLVDRELGGPRFKEQFETLVGRLLSR